MDRYFIIVPCYNEEEVLPETIKRLGECLNTLEQRGFASPDSRVLFVNDGSVDRTWEIIKDANEHDERMAGLCLDQNRGHPTALTEGLMCARDKRAVSVSIDADLQDDIEALDQMLLAYRQGNDVVYGVRSSRKTDSFLKVAVHMSILAEAVDEVTEKELKKPV